MTGGKLVKELKIYKLVGYLYYSGEDYGYRIEEKHAGLGGVQGANNGKNVEIVNIDLNLKKFIGVELKDSCGDGLFNYFGRYESKELDCGSTAYNSCPGDSKSEEYKKYYLCYETGNTMRVIKEDNMLKTYCNEQNMLGTYVLLNNYLEETNDRIVINNRSDYVDCVRVLESMQKLNKAEVFLSDEDFENVCGIRVNLLSIREFEEDVKMK